MIMKNLDVDSRITTYGADFLERPETVVCGIVREQTQNKAVRLLMLLLKPPTLKREMHRRVEFDRTVEKTVKLFIWILFQEALKRDFTAKKIQTKLLRRNLRTHSHLC